MSNGIIPSPGSTTIRQAKSLDNVAPSVQDPNLLAGDNIAGTLADFAKQTAQVTLNSHLNQIESTELTRLETASTKARASFDPDEANAIFETAEAEAALNLSRLDPVDARNLGAVVANRASLHRRDVDNHRINLNRRKQADLRFQQDRIDYSVSGEGQEDLTASAIASKAGRLQRSMDSGEMDSFDATQDLQAFTDRAFSEHVYGVMEKQTEDPTRFKRLTEFLNDDSRTGNMTAGARTALLREVRKAQSNANLGVYVEGWLRGDNEYYGDTGDELLNRWSAANAISTDDRRQIISMRDREEGKDPRGVSPEVAKRIDDMLRRQQDSELRTRGVYSQKGNQIFPTNHPLVDMGDGDVSNVLTIAEEIPPGSGRFYVLPSMVDGNPNLTREEAIEIAVEHGLDLYPLFFSLGEAVDFSKQVHDKVDDDGTLTEDVAGPLPNGNKDGNALRFALHGDEPVIEYGVEMEHQKIMLQADEAHKIRPTTEEAMIQIARESGKISRKFLDTVYSGVNTQDEKPDQRTLDSIELAIELAQAAPDSYNSMNLTGAARDTRNFIEEYRRFRFGISRTGSELADIDFEETSGLQETTTTGLRGRLPKQASYDRVWLSRHKEDPSGGSADKLNVMARARKQFSGGVGVKLALDELNNASGVSFTEEEIGGNALAAIHETAISMIGTDPGVNESVAFFAAANEWIHQRGFFPVRRNGEMKFLQWPLEHPAVNKEIKFDTPDGKEHSYGYEPQQAEVILRIGKEVQLTLQDPILDEVLNELAGNRTFTTGHKAQALSNFAGLNPSDSALMPPTADVGPVGLKKETATLKQIVETWAARKDMNVQTAWQVFNGAALGSQSPAGVEWEPSMLGDRFTKFGRDARNNPEPMSWAVVAKFNNGSVDSMINFSKPGLMTMRASFENPEAMLNPVLREWLSARPAEGLPEVQYRLDKARREAQERRDRLKPYKKAIELGVNASMIGNQLRLPIFMFDTLTGLARGDTKAPGRAFEEMTRDVNAIPGPGRQNLNSVKAMRLFEKILDRTF